MSDSPPPRGCRRRALQVLLALVLLGFLAFVLALPVANAIVGSNWFRGGISKALARGGQKVEIGRIAFWPRSGLQLEGVRVLAPDMKPEIAVASFDSLQVRPRWSSLFTKTFIIEEVSIVDPQLTVMRLPNGQIVGMPTQGERSPRRQSGWGQRGSRESGSRSPRTASGGQESEEAPGSEAGETDPDTTAESSPSSETEVAEGGQRKSDPSSRRATGSSGNRGFLLPNASGRKLGIGAFTVKGGAFQFVAFVPWPLRLVSLNGYSVELESLDSDSPSGVLSLEALRVLGIALAERAQIDVNIKDGGHLILDNVRAEILGGDIDGRLEIDPLRPGTPFKAELLATGLSATSILGEEGSEEGLLRKLGKLPRRWAVSALSEQLGGVSLENAPVDLSLAVAGFADVPQTIRGTLQLRSHDIVIENAEILEKLRRTWKVRSLGDRLVVDSLEATLRLANSVVVVDDLTVKSEYGIFRSRGFIYPDGDLQMSAKLYVTPEVAHFLTRAQIGVPEPLRASFEPLEHTTWLERTQDIQIGGNIRSPLADIWTPGAMTSIPEVVKAFSSATPIPPQLPPDRKAKEAP